MDRRKWKTLLCILLAVTLVSGCTSFQPVHPVPDVMKSQLHTGDNVRVVQRDGELLAFKVLEVGADGLLGQDQSVAYEDIAQIEVKRPDERETLWLVGGVLIGVGVLLTIMAIAVSRAGIPVE